jgi:hypothetical protein
MRQRQLGVTLSPKARAEVEAAAAAAGHSVSQEACQRIELTLLEGSRDPALRGLLADMAELAELVRADVGTSWDKDPVAFGVFQAAVLALLAERKPEGPSASAVNDLFGAHGFGHDDPPEAIGRALYRWYRRHQPRPPDPAREGRRIGRLAKHVRKAKAPDEGGTS